MGVPTRPAPGASLATPEPAPAARAERPGWPVALVLAGALAAVAAWVVRALGDTESATVLVSVAHLTLGLAVFLLHGGLRVSATGIYFFSSGLLFGGAGAIVAVQTEFPEQLWAVASLTFLAHLVLVILRCQSPVRVHFPQVPPEAGPVRWPIFMGLAYMAAGIVAKPVAPTALAQAFGFVGATLLAAAAVYGLRQPRRSLALPELAVASFGLAVFGTVFFTGFGRLIPINLMLVIALMVNAPWPAAWHKRAAVIAVLPLLLASGISRLGLFGMEADLAAVVETGRGLESVTDPVDLFAELVHLDETDPAAAYPRQYGKTLAIALIALVPRAIWPGKPLSFAADLSDAVRPNAPEGHSLATMIAAEFYVNFGWFALVLLPLAATLLLRGADRWLWLATARPSPGTGLVIAIAAAILAAGIMDLVWGGAFTFTSRVFSRWLVLLPLLVTLRVPFVRRRLAEIHPVLAPAS